MKRWTAGVVALAMTFTASCAPLPRERDASTVSTDAIDRGRVNEILQRYDTVRDTAIDLLDPKPLSIVETGAVLDIDTGLFEQSEALQQPIPLETSAGDVADVLIPRFQKYPLWFVATGKSSDDGLGRVRLFRRDSAIDPWLLAANPQTAEGFTLPSVRTSSSGNVLRVAPGNDTGMANSPQRAAELYLDALAAPATSSIEAPSDVRQDSFITQIGETVDAYRQLKGARFTQTWEVEPVEYALRLSSGGALAFATLKRTDRFEVRDGSTLTWPQGSPQRAYFPDGISSSAQISYVHQVLLEIPSEGGKVRAVGQWGGVVATDGS